MSKGPICWVEYKDDKAEKYDRIHQRPLLHFYEDKESCLIGIGKDEFRVVKLSEVKWVRWD